MKVGPAAGDLVNRYEYHLDFPGNALDPGCDFERWNRRLTQSGDPTVYAHVATDPRHPGRIALQYWLFYVFNDFNNLHEGDWEMIQLNFRARDATAALASRSRSKSATARTKARSEPIGATTSSSSWAVRIRSCTPQPAHMRTSSPTRSTSEARRRRVSAAMTPWSAQRAQTGRKDDPE